MFCISLRSLSIKTCEFSVPFLKTSGDLEHDEFRTLFSRFETLLNFGSSSLHLTILGSVVSFVIASSGVYF